MAQEDFIITNEGMIAAAAREARERANPIRSAAHWQHLREVDEYRAKERARLDAQKKKGAEEDAAEKAKRDARLAADRREAAVSLKAAIRKTFLSANASATDADFERLYPQLRDQQLLSNSAQNPIDHEVAALRSRYGDLM